MGPFGPRRNLKYDVIQSRLKECYYVELETQKKRSTARVKWKFQRIRSLFVSRRV